MFGGGCIFGPGARARARFRAQRIEYPSVSRRCKYGYESEPGARSARAPEIPGARRLALNPIIKWPGGKTRELARIRDLLPAFGTWVEPFVGGGALFFDLGPEAALLNDAEADLVDLYRAVADGDRDLLGTLGRMAADRKTLGELADLRSGGFAALVAAAREGKRRVRAEEVGALAGTGRFRLGGEDLRGAVALSVARKVGRLLGLEAKHDMVFGPAELAPHFETALQAGYYTWLRDVFEPVERPRQLARFYFVRTYCYGSMFRYSSQGNFNIPYGGISYNRVNLAEKVARLASPAVRGLLGRAKFHCSDFEPFLAGSELGPDAFVFFDPPYDTEFSAYANRAFTAKDQERLADVFAALPCPGLVVIRRTPFIESLYRDRDDRFTIVIYDKTYGYNVRGRNQRRVEHLLILNYPPPDRTGARPASGSPTP